MINFSAVAKENIIKILLLLAIYLSHSVMLVLASVTVLLSLTAVLLSLIIVLLSLTVLDYNNNNIFLYYSSETKNLK